jgi:drug/metabolite transporter (DMT)-like permease
MKKITNPLLVAIIWANISSLASGFMVSFVRHLSETMSVVEIIFFRNCFAFLMFIPILLYKGKAHFKTQKFGFHIIRSLTGVTSMMIYFYCISIMNLSVVTALSFTAPLFTAILAYFLLKDRFNKHKIVGLSLGFVGTLIVLRPGLEGYDPRFLLVILSAVFWAASGIIIKKLSDTESPLAITFYMTVIMMVLTAPAVFYLWKTPSGEQLLWAFLIAVTSNILQYGIAKSLSLANFSILLPIDFTRLVYTAILAYLLFNQTPDLFAAIGSVLILGAAFYSSYKESRERKAHE